MKKAQKRASGTLGRLLNRYDQRAEEYDASPAYKEQESREFHSRLNMSRSSYEYVSKQSDEPDAELVLQKIDNERYENRGARKSGGKKRRSVRRMLEAEAERYNPRPFEMDGKTASHEYSDNSTEVRSEKSAPLRKKAVDKAPDMGGKAKIEFSLAETAVFATVLLCALQILISLIILIII